ncbi:MAG: CHAD domain-containing protein [Desulfobulbus sp.]
MNPYGTETWLIPEEIETEQLLTALESVFTVESLPEYNAQVNYVDTFDWRLYRQEYLLHNHGPSWTLYHGESCEVTLQQGGPLVTPPCFAEDFPLGRLREALDPILGIRCLLPIAAVRLSGRQYRLLNQDEKTVVRLVIEWQRPEGRKVGFRLVRLFAVRGYDRELSQAKAILVDNAIREEVSSLIGFEEACRSGGRYPLDYSSKFNLTLNPKSTARQAMREIYLVLVESMRRNIPGVLADWDIEFLHDLRVAIRRTRSGLSLVKQVLPATIVSRFKKEFAAFGSMTGPTRDLDVYLKDRQKYLDRLPPPLQPGLELFFNNLLKQRQTEQKKLTRRLQTKKITAIFDDWQRCLEQEDIHPAPLAGMPVKEVADPIISRHHKRVLRSGFSLDTTTPDEAVHRLRIQCKKLRYSMEFFSSLYPAEELQIVVKHLKKLQDILGVFNDLSVQQTMLRETLSKLSEKTPTKEHLAIAAALGGLMLSLYQEQRALRSHFKEAFTQFSDAETTHLCHQLFKKKQETI